MKKNTFSLEIAQIYIIKRKAEYIIINKKLEMQ